ncbi:hypothetical protein HK104_007464 [Borealophlyctis nickersoniae]|nr:hypothetical protein HK104_007464 [Borealophlyctis nickersoniae]
MPKLHRHPAVYSTGRERRKRRLIITLVLTLLILAGIAAAVLLLIVPQTRIVTWSTGDGGGGGGQGQPSDGSAAATGGQGGEGGPGGAAGENPAFPYPCGINDGSVKRVQGLSVSNLPKEGGVYLGTSLDWSTIDPRAWSAYLGHSASIVDRFFHLDDSGLLTWDVSPTNCSTGPQRLTVFQWAANILQEMGGSIMSITVTPDKGLEAVTDSVIATIVKAVKDVNDLGVEVLVRFGHEMNGGWYIWGQNPRLYRDTFARISQAIKRSTTKAAMVWAPNNGDGYPFGGGQYTPKRGDPRFTEMDTNGDGVIDTKVRSKPP